MTKGLQMPAYKLQHRQGTETFHRITNGGKWIGRVYQHADGTYRAAIHKIEVGSGATAVDAFKNGVSKHLGYANVDELHEHNRTVRAHNKMRRQHAEYVVGEMLRGNFSPLDKMLGFKK